MKRSILFALLFAIGCGEAAEQGELKVALRQHQLNCDIPGLQAKLQISLSGVPECLLDVNADRTVTGSCPAIPTGNLIEVRLVYFVLTTCANVAGAEVELASAIESVDLRDTSDAQVTVSFPEDSLMRDIDQDNDTRTNLEEVCVSENPCGM